MVEKKTYTIMKIDDKKLKNDRGTVGRGTYTATAPKNVAVKFAGDYFKKTKSDKKSISIVVRETTRGSNKSLFVYTAKRPARLSVPKVVYFNGKPVTYYFSEAKVMRDFAKTRAERKAAAHK